MATAGIHAAAVLGDDRAVRRCLAADPSSATATSPPYGGDALNYLGLSRYLRLDRSRTAGFLRAARALLDAGADPNTGFWTAGGHPERETVLYGAAGVAHHPELTQLLLEHGADPNDVEVVYHSPEGRDGAAMRLVVETGRVTPENLALMLIRKIDWHDVDGVRYLLERGANPNLTRGRGWPAMHHALARDNAVDVFEALLDCGADPAAAGPAQASVAAAAAWHGRSDVLALWAHRGIPAALTGVDRLVAACARGDAAAVRSIVAGEPHLVSEVLAHGGTLLTRFAGTGNLAGVRQLLDLGVDVAAPLTEGDGYFGIPAGSLAIHVAAWRASPLVVKLLLARGSPVDPPDANGRTPLALAVRACVDSYWTEYRSPESVAALLRAGASPKNVGFPSGYAPVDALLEARHA